MKNHELNEVKFDANDNIDVDFYINKAHQLRGARIEEQIKKVRVVVKNTFKAKNHQSKAA